MAQIQDEVEAAERDLILKAFEDFKAMVRQHRQGGELRVAMEIDRTTGEPEVIFCGCNFKRSLESTRTLYVRRREQSRR